MRCLSNARIAVYCTARSKGTYLCMPKPASASHRSCMVNVFLQVIHLQLAGSKSDRFRLVSLGLCDIVSNPYEPCRKQQQLGSRRCTNRQVNPIGLSVLQAVAPCRSNRSVRNTVAVFERQAGRVLLVDSPLNIKACQLLTQLRLSFEKQLATPFNPLHSESTSSAVQ